MSRRWQPIAPEQIRLGRYHTLTDVCTCTDTFWRFWEINPYPAQDTFEASVGALRALFETLIDPLADAFGIENVRLTYGFCSHELQQKLSLKNPRTGKRYGRICPERDQHAALERHPDGSLVSPRQGAAVDLVLKHRPSCDIVRWLVRHALPYDAVYYYGAHRPVHLSYGPRHRRYICAFTQQNLPVERPPAFWLSPAQEQP